jgi:hypothetical protein
LIAHAIIVMRNWSIAGGIRRQVAGSGTPIQAHRLALGRKHGLQA